MMKTKYIKDRKGNIAIIVAVSLTALIGMLALVVDGGWLYASKNKYQNGVEAAAMAGAIHLCDPDPISVARAIAGENGIPSDSQSMQVVEGFYDEHDVYDDFSVYKDFAAEGDADYPDGEYNNAIMVSLNTDVSTFLAGIFGKDEVQVLAGAVAYLKRYGIVSLGGDVNLKNSHTYSNGDIYAYGDVRIEKYPGDGPPTLINCVVYAHGDILGRAWSGWPDFEWTSWEIWDPPPDGCYAGAPELTEIPPIDIDELTADVPGGDLIIYDADSSLDNIFFCENEFNPTYDYDYRHAYHLDLTWAESGKTYFFDEEPGYDPDDGLLKIVLLTNTPSGLPAGYPCNEDHESNGTEVKGVTLISRLPVHIANSAIHYGGEGDDQVNIIACTSGVSDTPAYVFLHFRTNMDGVYFRVEDYYMSVQSHVSTYVNKVRIIAGGDINFSHTRNEFTFGPPCPPSVVKLGKLEPAGG